MAVNTFSKLSIFLAYILLANLLINEMIGIAHTLNDPPCDETIEIDEDDQPCDESNCKDACRRIGYSYADSYCYAPDTCCCKYATAPETEPGGPAPQPAGMATVPCKRRLPVPTDGICDDEPCKKFCGDESYATATSQCLGKASCCCNDESTDGSEFLPVTDERVQCDERVPIEYGAYCEDLNCKNDCSNMDYPSEPSGCVWGQACCCNKDANEVQD